MGSLGIIVFQDFKERQVLWFLFPLTAFLLGALHVVQVGDWNLFAYHCILNGTVVTGMITLVWLYTTAIAKKEFLGHSIGLGDLLFFYALALGFPTLSFIVLFTGALLFSLLAYLIIKNRLPIKTVPLAGLMSLFVIAVLCCHLILKSTPWYGY